MFLHALADSLGSLGVIVSTVLVKYHGLSVADPICSFLVAVMVLVSGIPFLKSTALQLLLKSPKGLKRRVKSSQLALLELDGVRQCSLECWRLSKEEDQGSCTVTVSNPKENLRSEIVEILEKQRLKSCFV